MFLLVLYHKILNNEYIKIMSLNLEFSYKQATKIKHLLTRNYKKNEIKSKKKITDFITIPVSKSKCEQHLFIYSLLETNQEKIRYISRYSSYDCMFTIGVIYEDNSYEHLIDFIKKNKLSHYMYEILNSFIIVPCE